MKRFYQVPYMGLSITLWSEKVSASSSLHGIIIADAYGVPSRRLILSELIGGDFKFNDYYLSVNRSYQDKIIIRKNIKVEELLSTDCSVSINFDSSKLIDSCPFINYKNG